MGWGKGLARRTLGVCVKVARVVWLWWNEERAMIVVFRIFVPTEFLNNFPRQDDAGSTMRLWFQMGSAMVGSRKNVIDQMNTMQGQM